ncbi:MAG TPA: hypothetical protein VKQ31_07465 [Steroidobacteraceae bacterium]|nr:hypothetical protein [Steroidobacteraceae bacterium]
MLRKLILLLPVLLGATTALADGPSTDATAAGTPDKAASADAAKEPARKGTARAANTGDKAVSAAAAAAPAEPGGDVKMSGMSILGNEDAPKSLVLVPWKSSKLGDMPSVSRLLDSSKQPVDKEVFLRELSYYEFRTGTK